MTPIARGPLVSDRTDSLSIGSDPDPVAEAHRVLAQHYGEPVLPVSEFCARLSLYVRALRDGRKTRREYYPASPFTDEATDALIKHGETIIFYARKSNLLFRLLYLREPLRTEKCPDHDGHWSGCQVEPCPHGCSQGYDITGWLP